MTTQILDTRTQDTRASFIPINRLSVHEANARRTDKKTDIESLAASIEVHGLLQNLTVVARSNDRYAVVAGGRRLAAMKLLAKQGRIARDFAAPCQIVPDAAASETSLAENVQRVAMNVMDEVDAFERLSVDGQPVDDIVRRFGTTVRHVEQRLALARLSPKIKTAYRRAEITLDVARAFCLANDHAAQEAVFRSVAKPIVNASSIRAALTQGRIPAHDRLARYVGIEVYQLAGGHVSRDLFDDATVFLDDADLLRRLAADKTDALRDGLVAQGWGWAELQAGYGAPDACAGERLRPTRRELSAQEAAEREAIETRIAELDAALADSDDDDARWSERDTLDSQLNQLEQTALEWDPDLMKHAGVAIVIGPDGASELTYGFIKRADMKAYTKARRSEKIGEDADAASDGVPQCEDETHLRLPKGVTLDITRSRTQALRALLSTNAHVALAAVVDVFSRASRRDRHPAFDISASMKHFDPSADDDASLTFCEMTALSTEDLLESLAKLVAATLDVSHAGAGPNDDRLQESGDDLANALDLDMAHFWRPGEEFWRQVPKAVTLEALQHAPTLADMAEGERAAMLAHLGKMKKADLAAAAAQALEGTGWLPEMLITPTAPGALMLTNAGEAVIGETAAA